MLTLPSAALPACCHTRNAVEFATDTANDGGSGPIGQVGKPLLGVAALTVAVAFDLSFDPNPVWHVIWGIGTAGGHGEKWMSGC